MDPDLHKRFLRFAQVHGLEDNMKAASKSSGVGETYIRDAIKRGRGALAKILKVVEAYDPDAIEWMRTGKGTPPRRKEDRVNQVNDAAKRSNLEGESRTFNVSEGLILRLIEATVRGTLAALDKDVPPPARKSVSSKVIGSFLNPQAGDDRLPEVILAQIQAELLAQVFHPELPPGSPRHKT